ncbi:GTP-binding protein [Periconia macrospinosa]|uniref:GTP-binding protein n=1 Tax=Periconia macrospinosa TaxID=97972 RepID=A0A2V1E9C8_9PLEO|nr:GTP-binding protein [Periconia macrospinosa]
MTSNSSGAATPASIDPDTVTTSSLEALQSNDQRKVMDIVDKLRRTGLNGIVELPQLVVCGDQSSGKSSVLEAITEIPFPRKENLCTRFATEIILRRSHLSIISVSITPDKLRPKTEQDTLKSFQKSIADFSQLPVIIEEATEAMGLGAVGNSRAFSRDVLSIQIDGPARPQLTLVDLPGLIHSTNKAQTEAGKELILDLVKEYMKNERTIILAVVSAKNDYANQIVLDHARKADGKGNRTLGIITKPDYLREGSQNELDWIELAQNKNINLKNGWHMLKNRGEDQGDFTFRQRNEEEALFFSKGIYANLPREFVGIDSLRERLSKLLLNHLIKELPSLKREMDSKLRETYEAIDELGESRSTFEEQRRELMKVSMQFHGILKAAISGFYEGTFFGAVGLEKGMESPENIRRFRAVAQHLNLKFARDMRLLGHKFAIGSSPGEKDEGTGGEESSDKETSEDDPTSLFLPSPKTLSREGAIAWVKKTLVRTRGYELPGTFQPMLISQLFWEQSQPWEILAQEHVRQVSQASKDFIYAALKHAAPKEFVDRLAGLNVDAALQNLLDDAKEELKKLVKDKSRHPMTYNHYFTTTIQKQRSQKYQQASKDALKAASSTTYDRNQVLRTVHDSAKAEKAMATFIEQDMDTFSAQEALENQRAYYKDELKYFINAVCKTVIERHLVEPLPDVILSPLVVDNMTEQQISYVAAEPHETTQQRAFLEHRKAMLEKGLDTFREAMGGLRR